MKGLLVNLPAATRFASACLQARNNLYEIITEQFPVLAITKLTFLDLPHGVMFIWNAETFTVLVYYLSEKSNKHIVTVSRILTSKALGRLISHPLNEIHNEHISKIAEKVYDKVPGLDDLLLFMNNPASEKEIVIVPLIKATRPESKIAHPCGKSIFYDAMSAQNKLDEIARKESKRPKHTKIPTRYYWCEPCNGYHLTAMPHGVFVKKKKRNREQNSNYLKDIANHYEKKFRNK